MANVSWLQGKLEVIAVETTRVGQEPITSIKAWLHTGPAWRGRRVALLIQGAAADKTLEWARLWNDLTRSSSHLPQALVQGEALTLSEDETWPPRGFIKVNWIHILGVPDEPIFDIAGEWAARTGPEGQLVSAEPTSPRSLTLHGQPLEVDSAIDLRLAGPGWIRGRVALVEDRCALLPDGSEDVVILLASGMWVRRVLV